MERFVPRASRFVSRAPLALHLHAYGVTYGVRLAQYGRIGNKRLQKSYKMVTKGYNLVTKSRKSYKIVTKSAQKLQFGNKKLQNSIKMVTNSNKM